MTDALLAHPSFEWTPRGPGRWEALALARNSGETGAESVHLWRRPERLTLLDGIDEDWAAEAKQGPGASGLRDVLFLSRHAAASGMPSLTVHPIGNPRGDLEPRGGLAGRLTPPSRRLASLLRSLTRAHSCPSFASLADFDVTFEATHHGPFLATPSLFAEVGSTEREWGREDAGRCWAEALWAELSAPPAAEPASTVLLVIGGNHYMSQVTEAIWWGDGALEVGHMLPFYLLQGASPEAIRAMVEEAAAATVKAHPQAHKLLVFIFKKKMKSAHRKLVVEAVESFSARNDVPALQIVGSRTELEEAVRAGEAVVA